MRVVMVFALSTLLGACAWLTDEEDGYLRDPSDDYRKAQVEPMLRVPAGLDSDALQSIYVIPPITENLRVSGKFEVPRPAPLVSRAEEELVRIQKLGDEQWMLVSLAAGQLWPQIRAFLSSNGLPVGRVDARAGLIDSGWLRPQEGGMEERYRFRIEQGVQRNTSELHVLQMFRTEDSDTWPMTSADPVKEADMLQLVAQYVANTTEAPPVSMIAEQAIRATGKVTLQDDAEGEPYIRLELPYYRAWASVERALRESSFAVRDRDRSTGVYYIRYQESSDEDGGWFDWLFSNENSDDNSALLTDKDFILSLKAESTEVVAISIAREDKGELTAAQAQTLLGLIKGNIN